MFDTHMHTEFSPDSSMEIREVINTIEKLGIGAIITEHLDFDDPMTDGQLIDYTNYLNTYERIRSDKLLLGIELGLLDYKLEESRTIINNNPFDYVIGSIHMVLGKDIYNPSFYKKRSKEETYNEYLSYMNHCIKEYDFFDSLGHIDYISRYSPYDNKEIIYSNYSSSLDEIFKVLIEREKALELNTRRLSDPSAVHALLPLYKRYFQLGGRYVTLGSDAHDSSAIGRDFNIAMSMLSECGLKAVYFRNRKMEYA